MEQLKLANPKNKRSPTVAEFSNCTGTVLGTCRMSVWCGKPAPNTPRDFSHDGVSSGGELQAVYGRHNGHP